MAQPIAILGGTFDPVHNAHLAIARLALEKLGAEKVLWIPTGAPGYRTPVVAPAKDRLAMLRLALSGEPRFAIDERELRPGASGYTFDTVFSFQEDFPGKALVLLMGADQYAKRETWHRWQDLMKLCSVAVFARPGWNVPDGNTPTVVMTPLDISASEIRSRIARGEDVAAMLPAGVADYIRRHGLYR